MSVMVSKKITGNSTVTGEFPAQMASNAENVAAFDDVIMLLKSATPLKIRNT